MSRRPAVTAARSGAVMFVLAAVIAGCGSGSHAASKTTASTASTAATSPSSGAQSASPIARAALRSATSPGERVNYTLSENSASLGQVTVTGTGAFNNSPPGGQLLASVATSSSSGGGGLGEIGSFLSGQRLDIVVDKDAVYLKIPSSVSGLLSSYTGNKAWFSLDLTQLAQNAQTAGLASIFGGQGGLTNPIQALEQLEVAGADDVTKIGPATVDGVATTHYRATVEVAKLESLVKAKGAAAEQALAQLKATGVSSVPYNVYVDSAGLIRRVGFSLTATIDGVQAPLAVQTDFLSYGKQATPAAPAASDTASLDKLLSQLGA